ncbi:uncharacterized protein [Macrobrachium rosenbergii]|uniref:uncharacterized protein isoform X1 n=1 Tax=Macrobrachium rosenbergii TaxID=79674 RepID=UPI0034D62661
MSVHTVLLRALSLPGNDQCSFLPPGIKEEDDEDDEVTQATDCNSPSETPSGNASVSPRYLAEALRVDKGQDAKLVSWTTKDFTSKGDNFVSVITSVIVQYALGSEDLKEETYVVKIKQTTENGSVSDFDNMVFNKEGKFLSELLPLLNLELAGIGHECLKVPRFLHARWLENQNQLFLNDLRALKFKLYDRKMGLDPPHTRLVLSELGRLHAISHVLQSKRPKRTLNQDFNFLDWEWFTYSKKLKFSFEVLVSGGLITASLMAKEVGKDRAEQWFEENSSKGVALLAEQLVCDSPNFNVIGHGDCWINNLLFKYDDRGLPKEVYLLDLQFVRQSSLATDLSYFFFTSLERTDRRERLEEMLTTYYDSFKSIVDAALIPMPFTPEELLEEYQRRTLFGLIMSSLLLPNILCDPEEVQHFDAGVDGCAGGYIERKRLRSLKMLQNNGVFRKRMIDLFDDVEQMTDLT